MERIRLGKPWPTKAWALCTSERIDGMSELPYPNRMIRYISYARSPTNREEVNSEVSPQGLPAALADPAASVRKVLGNSERSTHAVQAEVPGIAEPERPMR